MSFNLYYVFSQKTRMLSSAIKLLILMAVLVYFIHGEVSYISIVNMSRILSFTCVHLYIL